jgi:hypothetical protein
MTEEVKVSDAASIKTRDILMVFRSSFLNVEDRFVSNTFAGERQKSLSPTTARSS